MFVHLLQTPPLRPRQNTMSLPQGGQGLYTSFELLRSGLDRTRYICVKEAKVCTLASSSSAPALTEHNISASRRPGLIHLLRAPTASAERDISASRRPRFVHLLQAPPLRPRQNTMSLPQGGQGLYTCFELLRSGLDRTRYLCVKEAKVRTLALSSSAPASTEHDIFASRRPRFVTFRIFANLRIKIMGLCEQEKKDLQALVKASSQPCRENITSSKHETSSHFFFTYCSFPNLDLDSEFGYSGQFWIRIRTGYLEKLCLLITVPTCPSLCIQDLGVGSRG
jgi:hypothetical protein